jgi:hypothetical protein
VKGCHLLKPINGEMERDMVLLKKHIIEYSYLCLLKLLEVRTYTDREIYIYVNILNNIFDEIVNMVRTAKQRNK